MPIVMISSGYQGGGAELAQALARKTNWPVLTRVDLLDKARELGVKVGRLEVAMIKAPSLTEKLARDKALYLALVTGSICEKARQGDLIYQGRAGHLMLPGVSHRLRVGLTVPKAVRIDRTVRELNLLPDKAENYLNQLDEDVSKWIRYVHRADGRDPGNFDVFLNLENMGLANASEMLFDMAKLPDFQPRPEGLKMLEDYYLSSQAKLSLAMDERTAEAELQIQADDGILTVTYPPQLERISQHIPEVLAGLGGCREILCTMAETNILWVQEHFEPQSENFDQIIHVAQRWGAAVELLRLIPPGEASAAQAALDSQGGTGFGPQRCKTDYDGGVEDDEPEQDQAEADLTRTQDHLVDLGRYGGGHSLCGGYEKILERAQENANYALVVIGNMFLSKGSSARTRLTRELAMNIRDRLKAPVITTDELKSRFFFGKRQAATLAGYLALVILVYWLVFTHQRWVLEFVGGRDQSHLKWLAPAAVALFVPLVAYIYGTVAGLVFKIVNID